MRFYLFVQEHVALLVHLVLGVTAAGSFAGANLDVDISLTQEIENKISKKLK